MPKPGISVKPLRGKMDSDAQFLGECDTKLRRGLTRLHAIAMGIDCFKWRFQCLADERG